MSESLDTPRFAFLCAADYSDVAAFFFSTFPNDLLAGDFLKDMKLHN